MRILIVESDLSEVYRLEDLLSDIVPAAKIVGRCTSVKETIKWYQSINNNRPDLIFAAIELNDGLSFKIFKKLNTKTPVIFICRHEKYAIDAFKSNGVYYLLKPLQKEELSAAITKYERNVIAEPQPKNSAQQKIYQERFVVSQGRQLKLFRTSEVAYFYTEHKIVYMVITDGSKYIVNHNLEQLDGLLNPSEFFRINRQFIINISSIVKMVPTSKSRLQVVLRPPTDLNTTTSAGRTDKFCKWMIGDFVKEL